MPPTPLAGLPDLLLPLCARAPDDDDAGFLARLYASTRMDLHSMTADPGFVASLVAMQQRFQAAGYRSDFPGASYLLLERSGAPCGRIVVDAGARALRLVDIALLPEARGQGLGSHILRGLQACAAQLGLPLTLSVHHSNPQAHRLYLALGFQSVSSNEVAEQMVYPSKTCT
ncbi:MAG: family N-acetyltransferase [Massilia sp.]|jgi:ribosomal protein S18 acetylase RimI-like enzyme|nr:family N-acetyltransferase [Massilia sp.]MDB5948184.1 family N-acetyltransferase [Massilia sp.]